ncbi:ATP-binding protein [Bacillus sp. IBL03825]|uniref:ATP-binding protein n=1 Tax=Bacillus sp. IBL03825 TaxID=2953580 RepID=UPI00280507D6|nr:ATP-binding protein [Bacillus sp. IBL03825]
MRFYRTATLVNELIAAKNADRLYKMINQIEKIDVLICDEWGIYTGNSIRSAPPPSNCRML